MYQRELCPSLPPLSWLCSLDQESGEIQVYHGSLVEVAPNFVVEGTWDGDFEAGQFHKSEHFFGSGVRFEQDAVHFVPSCALTDRLVYCVEGARLSVSNSLPLLLAATGGELSHTHDYRKECNAGLPGINDYRREFMVESPHRGRYRQLIYECMTWTEDGLQFWKRSPGPSISTFADYYESLSEALDRISANYLDERRAHPMSAVTTVSSGYDSAAVAAAVTRVGVREAFTSPTSNSVLPKWANRNAVDDSGVPVADALGLKCYLLRPEDPPEPIDELFYLAGNCAGQESLFHTLSATIEASGKPHVLYTGYHGGRVWQVDLEDRYLTRSIQRGDSSGLGLSEIRLKAGFVNVAIPFMFARRVQEIARVSQSSEMAPWRLDRDYDRPIPRRIAEEAGVPREAFGQRKKAVWTRDYLPKNAVARAKVLDFAWTNYGLSPRKITAAARRRRIEFVANIVSHRLRRLIPAFPVITAQAGDQINLVSLNFICANMIIVEELRRVIGPKIAP